MLSERELLTELLMLLTFVTVSSSCWQHVLTISVSVCYSHLMAS